MELGRLPHKVISPAHSDAKPPVGESMEDVTPDKSKDCQKDVSHDVAPAAPLDFQPRTSPELDEVQKKQMLPMEAEVQKQPMLPMGADAHIVQKPILPREALHRFVSPTARSMAAAASASVSKTSKPLLPEAAFARPKLLLPDAAFARVPVDFPEQDIHEPTSQTPRNKTTRTRMVSFVESAEWLVFDLDHPTQPPAMQSRPTSLDDDSPRSPRASHMKTSEISFEEPSCKCDETKWVSSNRKMQEWKDAITLKETPWPTHAEPMPVSFKLSLPTTVASASNSYGLDYNDAANVVASNDDDTTVATPKASLSLPCGFGDKASTHEHEGTAATPKASLSLPSGFGGKVSTHDHEDEVTVATPKASLSLPCGFGGKASTHEDEGSAATPKASLSLPSGFGGKVSTHDHEDEVTVATPKASLSLPCGFGGKVSTHDDERTVATPKASLSLPCGFSPNRKAFTDISFDGASVADFSLCATPKSGSSSSTPFGFMEDPLPEEDDCVTPKAAYSATASFGVATLGFGFCEALPSVGGDDLQSDAESVSSTISSHDECEAKCGSRESTCDSLELNLGREPQFNLKLW
jgi:hypothetical protein